MREIKKYLESRIGTYSFFFEDLESNFTYGYNEKARMISAGCMKLPIAVSVVKYVEENDVTFLDKIKIDEKDKVYGTGILHEFSNREYSIFELLVAMLIQSDNTAANKLIDILGMDRINEDMCSLGLVNTKLNRNTGDEIAASNGIENITSAADLGKIWSTLYKGEFLSKENSTMIIDILRRQQMKNKLALYIPNDLKFEISSKAGDKPGVENDTELIHNDKGTFAFSLLSMGIPNSVYGTVTIANCGKMMWECVMNNFTK